MTKKEQNREKRNAEKRNQRNLEVHIEKSWAQCNEKYIE